VIGRPSITVTALICPASHSVISLVNTNFSNPALSNAAGDGQCVLGSDCAFSGVVSSFYWSSSTLASNTNFAWFVSMSNGGVDIGLKTTFAWVWPVSGGQ
jgi:hypothetical protein